MRRFLAAAAAGVRAGIRPSGGSVTMEVRSVFTTWDPTSKYSLLYVPTPLPAVPSPAFCLAAARSHSAASAGVKNALSFSFSGRCRGVAVAEFQMPRKSGCPPAVGDGPCAAAGRTKDNANRQAIILSSCKSALDSIHVAPERPPAKGHRPRAALLHSWPILLVQNKSVENGQNLFPVAVNPL